MRWRRGADRAQEGAVSRERVEQRQQGRDGVLQRVVQGQELPGHFRTDGARIVAIVDMAVPLQQVDDGEVRCGLAIGHRGTLQNPPALGLRCVETFIDEAGLPHPRFSHQGDHLAMTRVRPCQSLVERLQFLLSPYKGREAPRSRGLQAPTQTTDAHQLKDLDGLLQSLHRHRPQRGDLHQPLHQPQGSTGSRMLPGAAVCSMRAARTVVSPTAE